MANSNGAYWRNDDTWSDALWYGPSRPLFVFLFAVLWWVVAVTKVYLDNAGLALFYGILAGVWTDRLVWMGKRE